MSLQINKIEKKGDASQEYLLMMATEDLNLENYAVVDRTFDKNGDVSNLFRHTFRFPEKQVRKGDYVSLRTGSGTDETITLNDKPLHRFHWGSATPVWNDDSAESVEVWKVATIDRKITGNPAPPKSTFSLRPKNLKYGSNK